MVAARKELLAKEKELTRRRDALNIERRNLPMVEIEKDYVFDGPDGEVRLIDMFDGRAQLIIYHFMFDPEWEEGCPSCTAGTEELSPGFFEHLRTSRHQLRDGVARAAREARAVEGEARVGTFPGTRRSARTSTTTSASRSTSPSGRDRYNYRTKAEYEAMGSGVLRVPTSRSRCPVAAASSRSTAACSTPTRSTRAGLESTGGSYYFLDLTALGRQEEWEEPKGRSESVRSATPGLRVVAAVTRR